jgi:ferredoxin
MALEIKIDHEVCTGSASCVRWLPGVFDLGDDGLAVVADPAGGPEGETITAAQACPTGAIEVWRDGELVVG